MSTGEGVCVAPHTSMYLDTRGNVLACCHTHTAPLGNVADASLSEIWHGPEALALRRSLDEGVLTEACRHCRWQLADGNVAELYAHQFDRFRPDATAGGDWPVQIEFALSNRCNLECAMCSGDFSSTIRSRREGRRPLPVVYGEEFFTQLRPFLAHLRQARFLGGEPFLVPEYQRIWDLLVAEGRRVDCDVTTNGTVWTPRIEATLEALPFSIGVSVDGVTRETVEAVRVGADFDVVMSNVERFSAYCARQGTPFTLTFCLVTANWHELPAFVRLADGLGADVVVNTVTWPPHLSLYELGLDDLDEVIETLAGSGLGVVDAEVERLRRWRDRRADGPGDAHFERWSPLPAPRAADPRTAGPVLHTDLDDVVVAVDGDQVLGVGRDELVGRSYGTALRTIAAHHGNLLLVADEGETDEGLVRDLLFDRDGHRTRARATTSAAVDESGEPTGARTTFTLVDRFD